VRGAQAVAARAQTFAQLGLALQPALVNGVAGGVALRDGEPFSVAAFTVRAGKIVEMNFLVDRARLRELDLTVLE
jgi:RNA polymerase sigma-70 factor (ECF subfamily)